ncbi:hypothetical protein pb186bvf_008617 [Paramecium bursaria]
MFIIKEQYIQKQIAIIIFNVQQKSKLKADQGALFQKIKQWTIIDNAIFIKSIDYFQNDVSFSY